jgi:predicted transcriptional regulator
MTSHRELQARDIMSAPVVSVGPETPVQEVAALLADRGISGVPVLAQGQFVGVVNEMDLLHRHEIGTERVAHARSWLERLFRVDHAPGDYVKSHGLRAKDVMTHSVPTIPEDEPLSAIASLFDSRSVRRLAVVRGSEVIGIVTRANVVKALATSATAARQAPCSSDQAIYEALQAELAGQSWWNPDWSTLSVTDGIVRFHGVIDSHDERDAARVAAENVPGVRGVDDQRQRYFDPLASM